MKIIKPTYLIAELQGEIEEYVFNQRSKFNPDRTGWPVDITIAGSSGVGTISEGQDLDFVVSELTPILKSRSFKGVTFENLSRFPNTGIYFLQPARSEFDVLHNDIKQTKVTFNETPWPYNPHCTLCARGENSKELETEFSEIQFPKSAMIYCFSLYQPESNGGNRIHKF